MSKEAMKLALDELITEYHMENTSFARRVDGIFKDALAEQPAQRKPLTDEEITAIYNKTCEDWTNRYDRPVVFARAIEAAHGIKENT
jgi:hypothetical protein